MRFKLVCPMAFALLCQGCVSAVTLSDNAKRVKVFKGEPGPTCKKVNEIESNEDAGDFIPSFESARNDAMNLVADDKGNAVRFEDASWRGTEVHLLATGFRCSTKQGLESDEQVTRPRYGSRFLPDSSYQASVYEGEARRKAQMLKGFEQLGAGLGGYSVDGTAKREPANEPTPPPKSLDFDCFNTCYPGFSYGLCESKCSY